MILSPILSLWYLCRMRAFNLAFLLLFPYPLHAFAQLPPDLQSALGPDVPKFRVRPGYRVTRALPRNQRQLVNARFIEFSADGKTLFVSQRQEGNILALRDP